MARLVVVGGGAAGMSAASHARRVDPGLEIIVVEASGFAAWGLCGIPYFVSGLVGTPDELVALSPETFRHERRIDLRTHVRAVHLDAARHVVETVSTDGATEVLGYDKVVVAAGASPIEPPITGLERARVFRVRMLEEAIELRAGIVSGDIRRCLVVGAGDIGLEMAEALAERRCEVTVVELQDQVTPKLDPEMANVVEETVRRHVDLRLDACLVGVSGGDEIRCHLDTGDGLGVDAVILATGVRPSATLASRAGAAVNAEGALLVDHRMRTSLPDVLAAGDCVAVHHHVLGRPAHVPLGPTANRTGRVAGIVAAGGDATFDGVVGTAVAKIFELTVAVTGLTLRAALAAGFAAEATDSETPSRARYYPGVAPTHVRLVHDRSGLLLGAQMVSTDPATAKRIDVVATALRNRMDVSGLADLDLSYAPPYAPVYDPIIRAAQAAAPVGAVTA
jgi:NADPH-dependent 2,4-dienoyl-CoA reductase/sulfur reductase-like enzyme